MTTGSHYTPFILAVKGKITLALIVFVGYNNCVASKAPFWRYVPCDGPEVC
jgi:hypothetical protein